MKPMQIYILAGTGLIISAGKKFLAIEFETNSFQILFTINTFKEKHARVCDTEKKSFSDCAIASSMLFISQLTFLSEGKNFSCSECISKYLLLLYKKIVPKEFYYV